MNSLVKQLRLLLYQLTYQLDIPAQIRPVFVEEHLFGMLELG
jgi:hypothetical protein